MFLFITIVTNGTWTEIEANLQTIEIGTDGTIWGVDRSTAHLVFLTPDKLNWQDYQLGKFYTPMCLRIDPDTSYLWVIDEEETSLILNDINRVLII